MVKLCSFLVGFVLLYLAVVLFAGMTVSLSARGCVLEGGAYVVPENDEFVPLVESELNLGTWFEVSTCFDWAKANG